MNDNEVTILNDKNVKPTAVRILVLDVFLQNDFAMSLTEIEAKLPWSDRSSIFRTLKTFESNGVIHKINDGTNSAKYELCSDSCNISEHFIHPHFHCDKCGKTICLEEQKINIENIPSNITINTYSLVLNGLCSACKQCN